MAVGVKIAFQKKAHDKSWNCSAASEAGIITDTVMHVGQRPRPDWMGLLPRLSRRLQSVH